MDNRENIIRNGNNKWTINAAKMQVKPQSDQKLLSAKKLLYLV